MDGGWALILSAVVTAVGGVIVTVIAQFRKENQEDHAVVSGMLQHVFSSVNRVEHKVDKVANGLESHLKEHKK
jgi:pantothenate kinase type III